MNAAMQRAMQWRLLAAWLIAMLLPTLVVWLPLSALLSSVLDYSPRAQELARHFDAIMVEDVGMAFARGGIAVGGAATLAGILTMLLAPLYAGMVATVARDDGGAPLGFVALVAGALGWYWRMFRVALVALVPFGVVGMVAAIAFKAAGKHAEAATTHMQAEHAQLVATIVVALLGLVAHATIEAARAHLIVDAQLRSAWRAWFRGLKQLRRPLPLFARSLLPTAIGFAVAFVLLLLRVRIPGYNVALFVVGFVFTQAAIAAIGWSRAARLLALSAPRA